MNSQLLQAPSRERVLHTPGMTLLRHCSWTRLLAMAVITLICAASAFASDSINVAPSSMFRPRGMVRVTIPGPGGVGAVTSFWVGDGASGFCRLDAGVLNVSTCFLNGTTEPWADDRLAPGGFTSFVFVADNAGGGVNRFQFIIDPVNPTQNIWDPAHVENMIGNGGSGLNPFGPATAKLRTESAKIGPDGKLYVTFFQSGHIYRITNPRTPSPIPANTLRMELVGQSDNDKRLVSMAFIGTDLWVVQAGFAQRIVNATACNPSGNSLSIAPQCIAKLQFQNIQFPMGMASTVLPDSSNPGGPGIPWLYFCNGGRIVRANITQGAFLSGNSSSFQIWTQGGIIPPSAFHFSYALPRGLNIDPATGDILITDAATIEAPLPEVAVPLVRDGRAWVLPFVATNNAGAGVAEAGIVDSPAGIGTPLTPNDHRALAATRAVLRVTGITHPRGLVFLGTHFWVSDEAQGFCRIDATGDGAAASLTHCFKPSAAFIAGQPAVDSFPTNGTPGQINVYLPDASGSLGGIARFIFNPVTENISQSGVLAQGRGTVATALAIGPEGSLYVGPVAGAQVTKIASPATAPSASIPVAATLNGQGVHNMIFNSFDLYMTENGAIAKNSISRTGASTVILNAAPDLGRGRAINFTGWLPFISGSTTRTAPPPVDLDVPLAMTVGPTREVPCQTRVSNYPPTLPSIYIGGAVEVDQWSFLCSLFTVWTDQGQLSPVLPFNVSLGTITAL
ncbi:MAG TPA: hypothetical protein VH724_05115, partial [Candidatus Angelobacter sp.]|nr:hypothetical protein [Candidatus Angelobacter sp.]